MRTKALVTLMNKKPWYLLGGILRSSCVAAYKAKNAASQAASYVNLVTPGTYNATEGATPPTWSAGNGWVFDGAGQNILTSLAPITQNTTVICRASFGAGGVNGRLFDSAADSYYVIANTGGNTHQYKNTNTVTAAPALTGVHTIAIAGTLAFLDGASEGTITTAELASTLVIGNRNSDKARPVLANIYQLAVYNIPLTLAQCTTIMNGMASLP